MGTSRSTAVLAAYLLTRFAGTPRRTADGDGAAGPDSAPAVGGAGADAGAEEGGGDFPELDSLNVARAWGYAMLWDVLVAMRRRRSCADPNLGFVRQLQHLEAAARAARAPPALRPGSAGADGGPTPPPD